MCTSPTTIYSCGHTKPDHIIEFCYTDYEDDCGQVHPRFERLARKCPGCTRREFSELERRTGIPAHGSHDEDAAAVSSSPRSTSPAMSRSSSSASPSSSPKGELIFTPATSRSCESAAKVDYQHRVVPATFKESVAVPPQLKCSPAESWLCECWDHSSRDVAQALLKQQDADGREELLQLSSPIPAKDSQSCTIDALLAENRRLALTVMLQTRIMTTELTASELRGKNDMLAQEARENEERLGELAGRKG